MPSHLWDGARRRQAGRTPPAVGMAVLCLMAAGCATGWQIASGERQAVIDRIVASSAKVIIEQGGHRISSGSGVVVESRTEEPSGQAVSYVLTAAHILDGKEGVNIFVRFAGSPAGKEKFAATVIRQGDSETLDLALLRVPGITVPAALFAADDHVRIGEEILVVGFPWGKRLGMFSGIVSEVPADGKEEASADEGTEQTIVVDATSAKGVSGGGVFREATGSLVGVVEGYQTASIAVKDRSQTYSVKVPMPGETFVVPVTRIRHFLDDAGLQVASGERKKIEARKD
ncbi:MAG: serine protease [Candidatus Methylomirabilales bacterium]